MTETAKVEGTNGKHAENGDMSELDKDIYKQVKRNLKIHKSIHKIVRALHSIIRPLI